MKLPIYQVDAFTETLFGGNPAAVCPLETWLPDRIMQRLAGENNLSETAFLVKEGNDYRIRWFTPTTEVALCGHATLASAHIIFTRLQPQPETKLIRFHSASGMLLVSLQEDQSIQLDFPCHPPVRVTEVPEGLLEGLGIKEAAVYHSAFDYMVVLTTQQAIEALKPDFRILAGVKARGVIATAKGAEADFVSRCFYPQSGIDEDPVTGSAHTVLIPFWANQLGKARMKAIQLSARKGSLQVELRADRALMSGHALTYMEGYYDIHSDLITTS